MREDGQVAAVTLEEVRHVAALASLELSAEEEQMYLKDLNAILGYFAELGDLDTAAVEPMAQVSELLGASGSELRADEPRPSLERGVVLQQAPATDGVFFKVPKVIER